MNVIKQLLTWKRRKLLRNLIGYNSACIVKTENRSKAEADYLAICTFLEDLQSRPRGGKGIRIIMDMLLDPKDRYHVYARDIDFFLDWKVGNLSKKDEQKMQRLHEIKKAFNNLSVNSEDPTGKWVRSMALSSTVIKLLKKYIDEIDRGETIFPACKRKNTDNRGSLDEISEDIWLETFWKFWDDKNDGTRLIIQLATVYGNQFIACQKFAQLAKVDLEGYDVNDQYCEIENAVKVGFNAIQELRKAWLEYFKMLKDERMPEKVKNSLSYKKYLEIESRCITKNMETELIKNLKSHRIIKGVDVKGSFEFPKTLFELLYDEIVIISREMALCSRAYLYSDAEELHRQLLKSPI